MNKICVMLVNKFAIQMQYMIQIKLVTCIKYSFNDYTLK